MLKAVGFTDEDLAKPIVGVATTWIETMPCNLNQRRLAEHVKAGIRAAGGTPMEFNTIAVSDGVTMGTEGMKASLVSREVVADSIELVVRGHLLDGVVCLVGCDKTMPGAAMALGSARRPGPRPLQRDDLPGRLQGQRNATVVTVYEAIGAYRAGKITLDELTRSRTSPVPGAGACGGQYTANTMSMVMEFIGLSPAGLNGIPAEDPKKDAAAHRTGELVMDLVRRDVRPSSIVTRSALENGIAVGRRDGRLDERRAASPGDRPRIRDRRSTSTSSGSSRTGRRSSPTCSRAGASRRSDMYDAGGVGLVMRELLKKGLLHGDEATVDGRTIAEIAAAAVETPGQEVVVPIETAAQADGRPGHPSRLARPGRLRRQARRPRASAAPWPGARLRLGGGLLRGRPCPADQGRRRRRHPIRGPGRRTRDAGDAQRHRRRSSARASATRSPSSPTAGSPAGRTG